MVAKIVLLIRIIDYEVKKLNAKQRIELEHIISELEDIISDEEDKLANLEENFSSTERYEQIEEGIGGLEEAKEIIQAVIDN